MIVKSSNLERICRQSGTSTSSIEEVKKFFEWIHQTSDGKTYEPNDEYGEIAIPKELVISHFNDPIETIVTSTYLNWWTTTKIFIIFKVEQYWLP